MDRINYLLPIFNALGAFLCVYLLCCYAFYRGRIQSRVKNELKELEIKIRHKLEAVNFQSEAALLLDERLDRLIFTLRQEIPMASLVLSGKLIQKLKTQAQDEILKIMPELKQKLIERLAAELDVGHFFEKMGDRFWKQYFSTIAYWAALIGFFVGFLLFLVIIWIGK